MSNEEKTHYRKAFNSPYLSSADVVEPVILTIRNVTLEIDRTKKTKDLFNTAHFVERFIRQGEPLKPMILNATNSATLKTITGSPFIDDWQNVSVTIYVDGAVRFGKETVEGLRLKKAVQATLPEVTPERVKLWDNAIAAFKRDGNFDALTGKAIISEENKGAIKAICEGAVSA